MFIGTLLEKIQWIVVQGEGKVDLNHLVPIFSIFQTLPSLFIHTFVSLKLYFIQVTQLPPVVHYLESSGWSGLLHSSSTVAKYTFIFYYFIPFPWLAWLFKLDETKASERARRNFIYVVEASRVRCNSNPTFLSSKEWSHKYTRHLVFTL